MINTVRHRERPFRCSSPRFLIPETLNVTATHSSSKIFNVKGRNNEPGTTDILFPTDFSHTGDAALELATSLARDVGDVGDCPCGRTAGSLRRGEMYYGMPEPATEDLQKRLAKVVPQDSSIPHEHHLITGDPAAAIARLAEDEGVDMIVMGTHGRTGLLRLLMGSVAEAVVRRMPCPVLTLKQPENTDQATEGN